MSLIYVARRENLIEANSSTITLGKFVTPNNNIHVSFILSNKDKQNTHHFQKDPLKVSLVNYVSESARSNTTAVNVHFIFLFQWWSCRDNHGESRSFYREYRYCVFGFNTCSLCSDWERKRLTKNKASEWYIKLSMSLFGERDNMVIQLREKNTLTSCKM